jgi:hypothetical protein
MLPTGLSSIVKLFVIPAKAGIQRGASATHMNRTAFQFEPPLTLVAQTHDAGFPLSAYARGFGATCCLDAP